jgi:hypothetical protein
MIPQKLILIPLLLVCFGLAPVAQAVGPDTDGDIPGANNGDGIGVLVNLAGGIWNTGTGFEALNHDTVGRLNTATGTRALFSDTSGSNNTANGVYALYSNVDGWFNSAFGAYALANNIEGDGNTAVGYSALWKNTDILNTAVGYGALRNNTTGFYNAAVGAYALFNNTTSGNSSNAFGWRALYSQTTGLFNNGFGWNALASNVTGANNTAMGDGAGFGVTGSDNTCFGASAGSSLTTGDGNVCIGSGVDGVAGESNHTYIGNVWNESQPYVPNTNDIVTVNADGRLGYAQNVAPSSRRYKHDIKPMDKASEVLFVLKPVTFRYNKDLDPNERPQWGLVAEEVEKVNPDLVTRSRDKSKVEGVRYEAINAMILNEFLKEHRTVEELKKEIAALTATVKEQAAQIQKVSAQVETSKPATKVVVNTP